jgi:hypothetical protein
VQGSAASSQRNSRRAPDVTQFAAEREAAPELLQLSLF